MNKKILALLSFIIVIVGMSTASAFDFNDVSNLIFGTSEDTADINGINFHIPEGFKELDNESFEDNNLFVDYNLSSKTFMNTSGEVITLSVSSSELPADDSIAEDASLGGNKTTINGVEGYESTDSSFSVFAFVKDDKLVIISTSDEELIKDIVVA